MAAEASSLFDPGFFGYSSNKWFGQIADDSTWRDNTICGKFEDKNSTPGWGYRYKVRIIGVHDQGEESIPSSDLPWAYLEMPATAGGGQGSSSQTPNIRQGMMVYGEWQDYPNNQVPIITGILANNSSTVLASTIGDNRVTNDSPGSLATSGYAQGQDPPTGSAAPKVPDNKLVVSKPKSASQGKECAAPPPGVAVNKYGLRPDISLTSEQLKDQQAAIQEAQTLGLKRGSPEYEDLKMQRVSEGIKNRCKVANSPSSQSQPGAADEGINSVHLQTAADVKRNELYCLKRQVPQALDPIASALKGIQIELENLMKEIDKYLQLIRSYIDAVSSVIREIQRVIANAACEIAKYMKVVLDQIFQYVLDQINKAMAPLVELMFPNDRYKFLDIREFITDTLTCLYNKLANQLCGLIQSVLDEAFAKATPSKDPKIDNDTVTGNTPVVFVCSVEQLVADVLSTALPQMQQENDNILGAVEEFMDDMLGELADIEGLLDSIGGFTNMSGLLGAITGSISAALNFTSFKLDLLGCDLKPDIPLNSFFTIQSGGGDSPQGQLPNPTQLASKVSDKKISATADIPFATPTANQSDINVGAGTKAEDARITKEIADKNAIA